MLSSKNVRLVTLQSFAKDKQTTFYKQKKEELLNEVAKLQEISQFETFPEYKDAKQHDVYVTIKSGVSKQFDAYGTHTTSLFENIEELIYNLRRKYPWITIVEKRFHLNNQNLCKIQLYSAKHQIVLCNKPFTNTRHILDLVKLFIDKCSVIISLNCINQDAIPIGGKYNNIYEQATVTLIQKDCVKDSNKQFTPARLLQITQNVNQERVQFEGIPINEYYIEIRGKYINYLKTDIKLGENKVNVQRNDLILAHIFVHSQGKQMEAIVQVNGHVIQYDGAYTFWTRVGQEYEISITKQDYHPISESIYVQGYGEYKQDFELIPISRAVVRVGVKNIMDKSDLAGVQISFDSNAVGVTNDQGTLLVPNLEFKIIKIVAKRKGFLTIPIYYDLQANTIGNLAQIMMLPDYFSLMNQFHVLVVEPDSAKHLQCSLLKNGKQMCNKGDVNSCKTIKIPRGQIINMSIHLNTMDVFDKSENIYSLCISNPNNQFLMKSVADNEPLKSDRTFTKSTYFKSRVTSIQESLLTERVYNKSKNQSAQKPTTEQHKRKPIPIVIYLTYGSEVITSLQVDAESIENNLYATINLNTRQVVLDGQIFNCKQIPKPREKGYHQETKQILQLLTSNI